MRETKQVMRETEQVMRETKQVMRETKQVMRETKQVMRETEQVMYICNNDEYQTEITHSLVSKTYFTFFVCAVQPTW